MAGIHDEATAVLVRETLHELAHTAVTAANGEEAWRIVQEEQVRVVIAEWQMPWLDGPQLCLRIRSQSDTPYTYIILISSQAEQRDRLEALTAGADDLLVKPLDSRELAARF